MGRQVFRPKQYSYYLGEQRPLLDIITDYETSIVPVTPTPTPSITPTLTPTPTNTPTPSPTPPAPLFDIGLGFNNITTYSITDGTDVIVAGRFNSYNGTSCGSIVKLDQYGNIDPGFICNAAGADVYVMVDDGLGNIYLGGNFTTINGASRTRLARIDKTTGAVDSFNPVANNIVYDILLDGSDIIPVGAFTTIGGVTRGRIAKMDTSGVVDTGAFSGTGFNNNESRSILKNASGNYVVGTRSTTYNGATCSRMIELDSSTYLDTGLFGTTFADNSIRKIYQHPTNLNYYFGGNGGTLNGLPTSKVNVVDSAGNVLTALGLGGVPVTSCYLDSVNDYFYVNLPQSNYYYRYDVATMTQDTTWNTNVGGILQIGGQNLTPFISIDTNNKLFITGTFNYFCNQQTNFIIRVNQNGTSDTTT